MAATSFAEAIQIFGKGSVRLIERMDGSVDVVVGKPLETINKENQRYNSGSINITQNASGRLGQADKTDETSYRQAKATLRNSDVTREEIKKAEETLNRIYSKKKAEMLQILDKVTKVSNATFTIENAGGNWMGGEEYSFRVNIQAKTQEDYNKALQAISYVAEGLKQDAFIENLGEVDEREVTNEGLLNGDYTPTMHIPFSRKPTAREAALIQKEFTDNSTEDLPLDATITDSEIVFNFPAWLVDGNLSDEKRIEAYAALHKQWQTKISNILKEGKNDRFKEIYRGDQRATYERSRFHEADSTEGEERKYSNYRNNNFHKQILSEREGAEIRDFATQVTISPQSKGMSSTENDDIDAFRGNNNQNDTLKALDEAIKTGNWTDEALDKLENLTLEDYDKILKRFSQEELRTGNGILTQAASILTRGDGRTDQKNTSADSPGRAKQQEQQIESWAKEAGLWYSDYQESKDGSLEGVIEADGGKLSDESGSEAMVFFTENSDKDGVIKAIDASHYTDSLQSLLDKIILHNSLFPETSYEVTGFGRDRGGTFRVIAKQKFIGGKKASVEDINKLIKQLNLEKKGGWYYKKMVKEYQI